MSTRWQIAAKLSDGRFGCIYVHCDGYPSHALSMLQQHYLKQEKIDRLIELGDCLDIGQEIGLCSPFSDDVGEVWDDIKPTYGDSVKAAADGHRHGDEEYLYAWDGSQWSMIDG